MSRLDELIQEYCPDGVEYRQLKDCCNVLDKKRKPITKAARETGIYPYYGANGIQDYVVDYIFDGTFILVGEDGSVITPTGRPVVNWAEGKIWVNNHAHIVAEREGVLLRFLYHFIQTVDVTAFIHGNIPKFTGGDFKSLQVPIPPLPVQEEIVRILDSFAELTAELQTHLHEELQARQKQYGYYCNYLLPFGKDTVQKVSLGNLCSIARGASPRPIKNFITSDDDGVNWIKIGDANPGAKYIQSCKEKISLEGAKKSRYVYPGDFILSNSMSFGRPYILQIEGCIHDGWLSLSDFEEALIPDYLYHVLMSSHIQKVMHQKASFGGAVQNLNADIVRGIEIPVPSLNEQRRIASLLDHFNTLCNDLTSGLPAEIENRQKQYEYYRDKLLTFKPLP